MKTLNHLFIILALLSQFAAGADGPKINQWGAPAGGLRMSLTLVGVDGLESNKPPFLVETITNGSASAAALGRPTVGGPIWFVITSPSGKDLSSAEPGTQMAGSATTRPILPPHESMVFKRPLNEICPLDEAGVYKYTAKVRVFISGTNVELVSNPLNVVLSESDIKKIPKPSAGF